MKIEPISAHTKRSGLKVPSVPASAVPTSTGATAAGSVRGRAATTHRRRAPTRSGALRELAEVGLALLAVGVASLLRLLRCVEEEVGVVREQLDPGETVLGGVEARLEESQREGGELQHLAAPLHRLLLQLLEWHDPVYESHLQRLLRVVLAAEEPDLLRLLRADEVGQRAGPEAAVEAADLRADLTETCVVRGNREVAHHVQHVAAADRVAGDHGDD